jgi:hypothetical protein
MGAEKEMEREDKLLPTPDRGPPMCRDQKQVKQAGR